MEFLKFECLIDTTQIFISKNGLFYVSLLRHSLTLTWGPGCTLFRLFLFIDLCINFVLMCSNKIFFSVSLLKWSLVTLFLFRFLCCLSANFLPFFYNRHQDLDYIYYDYFCYILKNTVFTRVSAAALIGGRRLFKHCTRQIYFFYIFIQRYTFYLLISLWTDTKLIVKLELREKFTR